MFKTSITPTNPNSFLKIGVCHGYHTAISFHLTPPSPPKEWGWVQAQQLQAQTCQPTKQRVVLLLDIHQRMATLDEERIHSHYICTINTCIPLVNLILRTSLACHMWDFLIDKMHIYIYIHWGIYIYLYTLRYIYTWKIHIYLYIHIFVYMYHHALYAKFHESRTNMYYIYRGSWRDEMNHRVWISFTNRSWKQLKKSFKRLHSLGESHT